MEITKLPKLVDKQYNSNLDSANKERSEEEQNTKSNTLDEKKRNRTFLFSKNMTDNNFNQEILLKSISKINEFDVSKKLNSVPQY